MFLVCLSYNQTTLFILLGMTKKQLRMSSLANDKDQVTGAFDDWLHSADRWPLHPDLFPSHPGFGSFGDWFFRELRCQWIHFKDLKKLVVSCSFWIHPFDFHPLFNSSRCSKNNKGFSKDETTIPHSGFTGKKTNIRLIYIKFWT